MVALLVALVTLIAALAVAGARFSGASRRDRGRLLAGRARARTLGLGSLKTAGVDTSEPETSGRATALGSVPRRRALGGSLSGELARRTASRHLASVQRPRAADPARPRGEKTLYEAPPATTSSRAVRANTSIPQSVRSGGAPGGNAPGGGSSAGAEFGFER